mgnify:CR=1 FL=1
MTVSFITKIFIFIIGTVIGSFLNVLIDRLPQDKSINGRSCCDHCKNKIAWFDLFPVISFFILQGKSRCCHKKLSIQYPLIEMITGLVFVLIWTFSFSPTILSTVVGKIIILGITSCLMVIFVSDLKYHLISDYILLALFVFSIIYHLSSVVSISLFLYFFTSLFIVAFPIWIIYFLSKERAMGLGDVYLAAIMGFLLGWKAGLIALYIAFVTGAIFGLFLILLKGKKFKSKIAFGPFLVIGTVGMLFWGKDFLEIIQRLYGL